MNEFYLSLYITLDWIAKLLMSLTIFSIITFVPMLLVHLALANSGVTLLSFVFFSYLGYVFARGYFKSETPFKGKIV